MRRARKNKRRFGKIFFCLVLMLVLLSAFVLFWGADNWCQDNQKDTAVCAILKPMTLLRNKILKMVGIESQNNYNIGDVGNSVRANMYRNIDTENQNVQYEKTDTNYLDEIIKNAKVNRD
jgi:histidinol phosphatase-like enzyme